MLKFFYNNIIFRIIGLLLTAIFIVSYPTGAASMVLCLDQQDNHLVPQRIYLDNCHTIADTYLPLSEEHYSAREERENNDCVDVSLTNANILNRPSKTTLPAIAKDILSYPLPGNLVRLQQQVIMKKSPNAFQNFTNTLHLKIQRTTVLLI